MLLSIKNQSVADAATLPLAMINRNKSGDNYTLIDHEKQVVRLAACVRWTCAARCPPIMQKPSAHECCLCRG